MTHALTSNPSTALSARPTHTSHPAPTSAKPTPSGPRETFERATGSAFGVLGAVLSPIPSAISGGLQGVRQNMSSEHLGGSGMLIRMPTLYEQNLTEKHTVKEVVVK